MEVSNLKRKTPKKRGPKNQASEYIKMGQIKLIHKDSKRKSYEVGYCEETKEPYSVQIKRLPGRQIITCSCTNHSKHPIAICSHKAATITYDTMRGVDYD